MAFFALARYGSYWFICSRDGTDLYSGVPFFALRAYTYGSTADRSGCLIAKRTCGWFMSVVPWLPHTKPPLRMRYQPPLQLFVETGLPCTGTRPPFLM